jgi:ATP-dependent DNA helicase RecG
MSEQQLTERRPVAGSQIEDLDLDLVRRHIRTAVERRGYEGTGDPLAYLQRYHCLAPQGDSLRPTIAGLLAFAGEPDRWLDTAGIDIAQFSGPHAHSTAMIFSRQIRGPIIDVINRTVDLLWARSEHRYRLDGAERIEEHAFNTTVLRELTVNTLCHRDWGLAGSIARIEMHPGFMRWVTPGGLPPGVTVENIRVAQVSRNPALAQLLYHGGLVEKFGMGIDTVLDTLASMGCEPPLYHDDTTFFTFQVFARPLSAAHGAEDELGLSPRQERLLAEIGGRRAVTSAELAAIISEARRNVQRDLQILLKLGLVQMDGPTSRARYRLARK